jgi:hypothetical protein
MTVTLGGLRVYDAGAGAVIKVRAGNMFTKIMVTGPEFMTDFDF